MIPGLNAPHAAHQGIFLNSWTFVLFSLAAVLLYRAAHGWLPRMIILAVLNCQFISFFLPERESLITLGVLLVGTYLMGEIKARYESRVPSFVFTVSILLLWLTLFLVKSPYISASGPRAFRDLAQLVGISYLMFRAIHYITDADILEDRDFLTYFNYMIFFATLLAGPIERYERFEKQCRQRKECEDPLPFLHRIANGVLKKFVLADNLVVFSVFSKPEQAEWAALLIWIGVLSQLLLLYLDFSGYCDIVIGIAGLMGFEIVENFNRPFLATNVQDFWNRWHISLTGFVRDYVFNPLNHFVVYHFPARLQFAGAMVVYFLAMLVIALWHATTWGFFIFGVLHGLALVAYQVFRRYCVPQMTAGVRQFYDHSKWLLWGARIATYCFISLTMLFWGVGLAEALEIMRGMIGL